MSIDFSKQLKNATNTNETANAEEETPKAAKATKAPKATSTRRPRTKKESKENPMNENINETTTAAASATEDLEATTSATEDLEVDAFIAEMEGQFPKTLPATEDLAVDKVKVVPPVRPVVQTPVMPAVISQKQPIERSWNEVVESAETGNAKDRALLMYRLHERWSDAMEDTQKYAGIRAVSQASWALHLMEKELKEQIILAQGAPLNLNYLKESVAPFSGQINMGPISPLTFNDYLRGRYGAQGEGYLRGFKAEAKRLRSYGNIEPAAQNYQIELGGKVFEVTAAMLHCILRCAKPDTLQSAPYSIVGVQLRGDTKTGLAFDGKTMVFPKEYSFTDVNGVVVQFKADVRLSMPALVFDWNYYIVAFMAGEYTPQDEAEEKRLKQRAESLSILQDLHPENLQAWGNRELNQVQAYYCYLRQGDQIFGTGRMLAGLTLEILLNIDLFTEAWRNLQAEKAQKRAANVAKPVAGQQMSTKAAPVIVTSMPAKLDYNPLSDVDLLD